jgi:hypothetical protein
MAKLFKSSLPKVISKANRDISTIIENDIANESLILKNLVDQVLAANMEVKKKNNQRITETKRKLQELDIEIDELNKSIDLVDRETVIEQLNQMIDAENKIFKARHEIRFFENEEIPTRLDNLNRIYKQLDTSIDQIGDIEAPFVDILEENNELLFTKQLEVTTEIVHYIRALNLDKRLFLKTTQEGFEEIYVKINNLELQFFDFIKQEIAQFTLLSDSSETVFTNQNNDDELSKKINEDHTKKVANITEAISIINNDYTEAQQSIIDKYTQYENVIREKYNMQNEKELVQEKLDLEKKEEELQKIKLLIIDAEKKENIKKVQKLIKEYDRVEKTKESTVTDQTDKLLQTETKKSKDKAIRQLEQLEIKLATDLNKQELELELERINFEESKILFKIKTDFIGLQSDAGLNKKKMESLALFLNEEQMVIKELYNLKLNLRLQELEVMKQNELLDNSLTEEYRTLLLALKDIEFKRRKALLDNSDHHERIKVEQNFHVQKTILDLKLNKELSDIDKLILKKQNESLIKIEKLKEEANSEVIFQESLIKIAKKERELQLVKVNSLYENERSLAEEQVERIGLGVQVNDTFVKTTLENQLLFATQQIKCADSEFDIRVESVSLTKDQELAYATKKIDYYRQKYEYEKSKIIKERDDKLEDLNFKLLLFTEKKDNEELQEKVNELMATYQVLVDEIEEKESMDEEIIRYEKVIDATESRAAQAINEAIALKEQTKTAFETLYEQTKSKYDQIKETNRTEETVGIMPLLNSSAVSSADTRLKQAIMEADDLYKERIVGPESTINERKSFLLEMTNDKDITEFCDTQKNIKKEKIDNHKVQIEALEQERNNNLENLSKVVPLDALLEEEIERVNTLTPYRTNEVITSDYTVVIANERSYISNQVKTFDIYKAETLKKHVRISKEIAKELKSAIGPYKKYIRSASRGLNQEKREIIRKNKRILKKAQTEALEDYECPIK